MDSCARANSISGLASFARPFTSAAMACSQSRKALGRVVKIGDGFVQPRRGQAGKLLLEAAESLRRLERLLDGSRRLIAARVLNKAIGAPGFSLRVLVPVAAVARRNQRERAAIAVRLTGNLRGKMRRDALDVLHHRGGRAEDLGIDALQDVAHRRARRLAGDKVGVVDVAVAVRREGRDFAVELERRDGERSRRSCGSAHGQSFSG